MLPNLLFMGGWVFFCQSIGHVDGAKPFRKVFFVDGVDVFKALTHWGNIAIGEHSHAVIAALAF